MPRYSPAPTQFPVVASMKKFSGTCKLQAKDGIIVVDSDRRCR